MRPINSLVYIIFSVSLEGIKRKNFDLFFNKFFDEHCYKISAAPLVNSYFSDAPISE